jgi:hypothetical protein
MTAFIDEHRDVYGVEPICKMLPIGPSTYYVHAARKANPALRPSRALRDERLCVEIRGCTTRAGRSTACARCDGSWSGRATVWRAAPWRA